MHLIVGLGNPGKKYEQSRHNVGWLALDGIINEYKLSSDKDKFESQVHKGTIIGIKVLAIKPLTFMNESGKAVSKFVNFYKIEPKNVIVIHDDLDMETGKVRMKIKSGDGGHNGIKSINSFIKNEYIHIKVGIGHPEHKDAVQEYVLSKFPSNELKLINHSNKSIANLFECVISGELDRFKANIGTQCR